MTRREATATSSCYVFTQRDVARFPDGMRKSIEEVQAELRTESKRLVSAEIPSRSTKDGIDIDEDAQGRVGITRSDREGGKGGLTAPRR